LLFVFSRLFCSICMHVHPLKCVSACVCVCQYVCLAGVVYVF